MSTANSVPLTASLVNPPYATAQRLPPTTTFESVATRCGSVILLDFAPGARDGYEDALELWTPRWRRRFPALPLAVRLDLRFGGDALEAARKAGHLGLDAVVAVGEPLAPQLRQALTRPVALGTCVLRLLPNLGVQLNPSLVHVLAEVLRSSRRCHGSGMVIRAARSSESTMRARLRKKGLPSPCRWLELGRALHAALAIQRDEHRSILSVAIEAGYADDTGLHRLFRCTWGLRPRDVRGTLGWQWLVERWLVRLRPQ